MYNSQSRVMENALEQRNWHKITCRLSNIALKTCKNKFPPVGLTLADVFCLQSSCAFHTKNALFAFLLILPLAHGVWTSLHTVPRKNT